METECMIELYICLKCIGKLLCSWKEVVKKHHNIRMEGEWIKKSQQEWKMCRTTAQQSGETEIGTEESTHKIAKIKW